MYAQEAVAAVVKEPVPAWAAAHWSVSVAPAAGPSFVKVSEATPSDTQWWDSIPAFVVAKTTGTVVYRTIAAPGFVR
ncbi:MAG: hypothetical protein ACXVZX_01925 [Terriglobales bacterium]